MDAPLHRHATLPDGSVAGDPAVMIPPETSSSGATDGPQPTSTRKNNNKKKKKKDQTFASDNASLDSSSNCSSTASYSQKGIKVSRNPKVIRVGRRARLTDADALGLPLGMSIAAVVAQVLKKKKAAREKVSVDSLSEICGLAVRESLENVFGDKYDNFVTNFETSFRSTLMTLQLISEENKRERLVRCSCSVTSHKTRGNTVKNSECPPEVTEQESCLHTNITEQKQGAGYQGSTSEASNSSTPCSIGDLAYLSSNGEGPVELPLRTSAHITCHTHSVMEENVQKILTGHELVLHDKRTEQQLVCSSPSNGASSVSQLSMLSTIEKSVMEQTRSNDLKTFEIGLIMKKMQLKERQLELSSNANFLERWKLSMGISKASFKAEKFKTEMHDMRQVELLKRCLDFLVGGLIIMLFSLAYGTYVYSHQRIIEATEACSPHTGSSSWWMPKSMSTFNSGMQLLKCQIQVFSRMLFGALMIAAIAFLLIQRSSSSHQAMPVTFILLLLGVVCGYAGKFCIDTLGGSGIHWLGYWEVLCLVHFLSNVFHSTLYIILNGPIIVAEKVRHSPVFPYWTRKLLFYATLLVLPLLCGCMPFAGPLEWFKHFSSQAADMLTFEDD